MSIIYIWIGVSVGVCGGVCGGGQRLESRHVTLLHSAPPFMDPGGILWALHMGVGDGGRLVGVDKSWGLGWVCGGAGVMLRYCLVFTAPGEGI